MGVTVKERLIQGVIYEQNFFPIRLASLRIDTVTDFDLYLLAYPNGVPVLYRQKNLPFGEEARRRLGDSAVVQLYVRTDQVGAYRRYVEANLSAILADPDIGIEEKSEVLYTSAAGLVQDVLDDPRAGDVLSRSKNVVENTVTFVLRQEASIENLLKVTSYDYYTYTHSVNVFVFSVALARRMGHEEANIIRFGNGALLHDIGKCMIDPAILNCPGKLSTEQWNMMKQHPVFAYNILTKQGVDDMLILDVVRHHHEKLTGRGYPDALQGSDISEHVRISTIADIFDALTTRRPYKEALRSFDALRLMKKEMTDDLDAAVFQCFVEMLGRRMGIS